MIINWNQYLSRYQQARGGLFFGALGDNYDSHLVITDEKEPPILAWVDTDPSDGAFSHNMLARTMVKLDGSHDLYIHPRSLVSGVASFVRGDSGFGHPEATKGRNITTNNKAFAQQILAEPGVREGLSTWKKVYLRITPAPQQNGWHVIEIADIDFEGTPVSGSHWLSEAMLQDPTNLNDAQHKQLLQEGSEHFNIQMDAFLNFIRSACRAACAEER